MSCWQQHFQQHGVFAAFECKTIIAERKQEKKLVFGPIRVELHLQAFGQNNKPNLPKRMRGVLQLFLQRFFGIQKLQKHHVAGNAVTRNNIRQGHFLQEGQIFNTLVEIAVLKYTPCFKQCYCLHLLLSTAFPATWCFGSFRMQNKLCKKS